MFGNRGIYHNGWTAVTKHRTPWKADTPPPFDDDVWELYGPDDWTQAHNLAAENPEKLAEMQRLWLIEAVKYNVVPLDDRSFERINPDHRRAGPQLIRGNTQLLFAGMRVSENCVLTLKNKSHSVTANITVPESGANGVIVTQGGSVGGWSLYAHEGRLKYCYNFFGIEYYVVAADEPIPIRRASGADGIHLRRWGFGQGRRRHPVLRRQSRRHRPGGADRSRWRSPPTRPATSAPTPAHRPHRTMARQATSSPATIDWVQLDIGEDSHDHLIKTEDRFSIAMSRQ